MMVIYKKRKERRRKERRRKERRRDFNNASKKIPFPNFTLSGSPGACGFSLLTLARSMEKGYLYMIQLLIKEKKEGKKKKKKKKGKRRKKEKKKEF